MCAVFFLSLLADFVVTNVFSSSFLLICVFSFCLPHESKHSALCSARRFFVFFVVAHVPAPYVIVGVTSASNRFFIAGTLNVHVWRALLLDCSVVCVLQRSLCQCPSQAHAER